MPSGFGVVPSQTGGSSTSGGFNFPWVSTPFPRGTSLGGNFSSWGGFPFVSTSGPGGFFPRTNFGNIFPGGSTFPPGGNPLGGIFGSGSSHAPGGATIPVGTHSSGAPQPSSSTNIGGPQGPSGTTETSPPSQSSFAPFPFLATLDLPDLSWLKMTLFPMTHHGHLCHPSYPQTFLSLTENPGEDPSTHIMTYHLWCSSNSLMDDSVRLHLFQRSLTKAATKWYIELKGGSFRSFNDLAWCF
jgi:hypothetical protein